MRLTCILLFLACLQVSARGYGQKVTLAVKNAPLEQVFNLIEKQTGYSFYYKVELLKKAGEVSVAVNDAPLERALQLVLQNQPLTYNIVDNNIIIRARETTLPESIGAPEALSIRVSGVVLDKDDGVPLSGASVVIKGTKRGVATDKAGAFALNDVPGNAALVVSYSGYKTREVDVAAAPMTIRLEKAIVKIDEIVINTGIYNRPKESFTGAVTTVTGNQLRSVNGLSVLQALKVFDPAVHIPDNVQFGSDPNRLPTITLRGTNNFPVQGSDNSEIPVSGADFSANYMSNPNQPLFILDGFEVSIQKVYDLDITRIATFTILKDAAATAIYGSRAANGVIVVETVQPRPGKLRLSYSGQMQITAPDLTVYDLTNAAEKLEVERLAGMYSQYSDGTRPDWDAFYRQLYSSRLAKVQRGVNTYWLSQPVRTGFGQRHSINLEGGDGFFRYGIDFSYNNNTGVMKNSNRNNYSGGMNVSYRYKSLLVKNVLSVQLNSANNSNYGAFSEYSKMNPYWAPYDENGNPVQVLEEFYHPINQTTLFLNPLYNTTLHTVDKTAYTNLENQTFVEWRINSNYRLTGKMKLTKQVDQGDKFLPAKHNAFYNEPDITQRGSYSQKHSQFFAYDGSLQLDFNKRIGQGFLFNTTGASIAETNSTYTTVLVKGFPHDKMDDIGFGNGYPPNTKPGGGNTVTRRVSAFSNFNYTYDNRYLADFSISADGSSQFGVNKRFAPFWSTGIGWNLHNERFFRKTKLVSQLRLRASIGTTGDNRFPPSMGITTYNYFTDQNYRAQVGAVLMAYGNENLQWQQTIKRNLGTDMILLDGRLNLTFNYYRENTKGLILDINTPPSAGVTSYKENVGEMENNGYEFTATVFAIKDQKKQTYWSVFVNGNHNKNYIKSISNSLKKLNEENDKNDQTRPRYRFEEGQSTNVIWAVRSVGIDPSNGREVFVKKDGTLTYTWDPGDKVIVGDNTPELNGNFGTNLTWRGLTLGLYFDFQFGGQMYNQTLQSRVEGADLNYQVDRRVLLGRWTQPGDVKYFQRLLYSAQGIVVPPTYATSRFVQDNNYVNAASISLGYQVPDKLASRWSLANTRLSFIANDIKRWSSIQVERGLDYPFARNFTISISTSFK